jgi:hypothetical protein
VSLGHPYATIKILAEEARGRVDTCFLCKWAVRSFDRTPNLLHIAQDESFHYGRANDERTLFSRKSQVGHLILHYSQFQSYFAARKQSRKVPMGKTVKDRSERAGSVVASMVAENRRRLF